MKLCIQRPRYLDTNRNEQCTTSEIVRFQTIVTTVRILASFIILYLQLGKVGILHALLSLEASSRILT